MIEKNLQTIKKPAKFRFMSYCGDKQGCGSIRIIYPSFLLEHCRPDGYAFSSDYLTSFVNDVNFYKSFTFVQFQRSATDQHLKLFHHYIQNIRPHARVPIIYEIDDLLMDIPEWNYAASYYNNNTSPIFDMMRVVDGMTVSTEVLKEEYGKYCNNIVVIPNHLPKFIWGEVVPKHMRNPRELKDRPRIGWAGSENHFANPKTPEFQQGVRGGDFGDKMIEFIKKTVDIYQWVLSGACPVELDCVRDKIECHGWVPIFNYPQHLKKLDLDIGMALLQPCRFNDSKCLVGNTKVISNKGIMNISNITNENSLYQKDSFEQVSNVIKYENKETLKITTSKGYSIEGTLNHKICKNGEYVRLDTLEIGDEIDLSFFDYPDVPYVKVSVPFFLTKKLADINISETDDLILPKVTINEDWGYFIGLFLGDGNIGQNESVNISCDDRENISDIVIDFGKRIGLSPKVRKSDKRNTHGLCVHLGSRNLKWLFSNKLNIKGGKLKKNLNVPQQIFQSPKSVIKEFISGLFDADGTIDNTGCSFTTKNKQLAEDIQFLLLGFGILSRVYGFYNKKVERMYYTLSLSRQASDIFYKEIGFRCIKKFEKLLSVVSKPHSNKYKEWELKDKIVSIENKMDNVYDVEIPNNHFYVANGFVSHNSNIKALEMAATGVPGVYSDSAPYRDMSIVSNSDDYLISEIEKLVGDLDYRKQIFEQDYKTVEPNLFWEDNNNLLRYVDSYLSLFGKKLESY